MDSDGNELVLKCANKVVGPLCDSTSDHVGFELAGWLVGWLAGWLVGWLAGWLVGIVGQLVLTTTTTTTSYYELLLCERRTGLLVPRPQREQALAECHLGSSDNTLVVISQRTLVVLKNNTALGFSHGSGACATPQR